MRLDAHVHVWADPAQRGRYPVYGQLIGQSAPQEPPGSAEDVLAAMDEAGVAAALVVQPGNHLYDHSYLADTLRAHPDRFVGCMLADPRPEGGGLAALEELAGTGLFRAVRFNPYLWPEGQRMDNQLGSALYERAGQLGLPVAFMPFKGLPGHMPDIQALIQAHPGTSVILDHFGFARCDDLGSEQWRALLTLAAHPQVHVKASAFFRVSTQAWPYLDACEGLRKLVDVFGADRVMWGTDMPWVQEKCGYNKAWTIMEGYQEATGAPLLTDEERAAVMGGTLSRLLPGAWPTLAA